MTEEELKALQAQLATTTSLSTMSDAEKTYLKSLPKEKQDAFTVVAVDKRADFIKSNPLVIDDGETIVVAGETIAKKDVGAAMFNVLKAQNSQINTMSTLLSQTTGALELETFCKRAEMEYPYLPGTREEKGAMLKELDKLPEVAKKATLASLKAASEAIKFQTTELGAGGDGSGGIGAPVEGTAAAELENLAKKRMSDKGETYDAAYTAVLQTRPDLYEKMETEKPAAPKAA